MTLHREIADKVRVFFKDGSSTVTHVLDDESIADHIVELCEREGWDLSELADYQIVGTVYADDFGIEEV